jgi:hypothetical protein
MEQQSIGNQAIQNVTPFLVELGSWEVLVLYQLFRDGWIFQYIFCAVNGNMS